MNTPETQSGGSLKPSGSAREDTARIIQAWNNGVEKWYQRHDSIPAAFVELAHVIDGIQKHTAPPNAKLTDDEERANGIEIATCD
jgi:dihydrodipicolinate synthase/N-acetylneuraminate lyase